MALSSIELFAGVGMLGEGVRAGLEYMGIGHRTVCYVERESYAAAVLVSRMEEGSLDPAFAAWLMGWPPTWTIAAPSSCGALATASWRCSVQRQLSCLLKEQA